MSKYDVCIVGAGCAGLVSACMLKRLGYKVLLLDEHNSIGGVYNSITKGRFEFEPSFHSLYLNNSSNSIFSIDKLFKELGIKEKIELCKVSEACKLLTISNQENEGIEYYLPFGIDNFINKCSEIKRGCGDLVQKFFDLALECREVLKYFVIEENIDYVYLNEHYENFCKIGNASVKEVLDMLEIPKEIQELICSYWFYLGSSCSNVSFVQYASMLYEIIDGGVSIPKNRNYDITYAILNRYLELGGEIKYNSKVVNIIIDSNHVSGVKLYDGTIYNVNKVIVNSNMKYVYDNLIDPDLIPVKAKKSINAREMGPSYLTVHMGLNRSAKELGLKNYSYLIYNSLDSDIEENRMSNINSGNMLGIVLNKANSEASLDGTCMVSLSTLFFNDCFIDTIGLDNYYDVTSDIANNLIKVFEDSVKVSIKPFIEEVEIRTSLNTLGYVNNSYSNLFGFKLKGLDNLLPRILNHKNEQYISGLYVCGGFNGDIYGIDSTYYSGYFIAKEVDKDIRGDRSE